MTFTIGRNVAVLTVALLASLEPGGGASAQTAGQPAPVKLFIHEVPLTVLGKKVRVVAIDQANGVQGYSPQQADGFHVVVVNQLPVPTTLHWHGLIEPNAQDGVPYVTQDPIPPRGSQAYDFPLVQSGTFWMHSLYGLQEQQLDAAPLVIRSPEQDAVAGTQYTVMLSDFSFSSPTRILSTLLNGPSAISQWRTKMDHAKARVGGIIGMGGARHGADTAADTGPKTLLVQQWDAASQRVVSGEATGPAPDTDVKYDALLADRRTIDNPEVLAVKPGETVLLRLIAASAATNFFVDTGALDATIVATDGENVQPLKGNFFQLGIAQRLDLLVTIPAGGGAFPILALGEGTRQRAGVILSTAGAKAPSLGLESPHLAGGLDNTQELHLAAKAPLPDKPVQRWLPSVLAGTLTPYVWTINGSSYPNQLSLDVKEGQRVQLSITNASQMPHPMHLHGHIFEVSEIDGQKVTGAVRDTVLVPPKSTIKVLFDANNPGIWAYHCHIVYHLATGMFTVIKYDGVDTSYWQPDQAIQELKHPLNLNLGLATWTAETHGLFTVAP